MRGGLQVRLDGGRRCVIRIRLGERGDLEQFVNRGRLVALLGEAIALGERGHFLGVDPVYQAVELGAQPGVGPGAIRRLEQHVERLVELGPRPIQVSDLHLPLAGVVMLLRRLDERGDGISGRWRRRRRRRLDLRRGLRCLELGRVRPAGCNRGRESEDCQRRQPCTSAHLGAPARASGLCHQTTADAKYPVEVASDPHPRFWQRCALARHRQRIIARGWGQGLPIYDRRVTVLRRAEKVIRRNGSPESNWGLKNNIPISASQITLTRSAISVIWASPPGRKSCAAQRGRGPPASRSSGHRPGSSGSVASPAGHRLRTRSRSVSPRPGLVSRHPPPVREPGWTTVPARARARTPGPGEECSLETPGTRRSGAQATRQGRPRGPGRRLRPGQTGRKRLTGAGRPGRRRHWP